MPNKKPTIKDVANKLGVTTSTVSRALIDHHTISDKTKKLVRKVCKELGYTPNKAAANLRTGKGNYIGVVVPVINSSFFSNCIAGIERVVNEAGYNLIICQSNEDIKKEGESLKSLLDHQVSGILISLSIQTKDFEHFEFILSGDIPLVMFDRIEESIGTSCVTNNDFQSTLEIVEHLHNNGYRKLSFFNVEKDISVYKNRLEGFIHGLKLFELNRNNEWIIDNIDSEAKAYEKASQLLERNDIPDAFICTNDMFVIGIYEAIKEKGLSIPYDIGVVGYANEHFSKIITPSLTTVEQFPQEVGSNAADLVLDLIKNKSAKSQRVVSIKPKLIVRESSVTDKKKA